MRSDIVAALRGFDAAPHRCRRDDRRRRSGLSQPDRLRRSPRLRRGAAEAWIREWETFYGTVRRLTKPIVIALNGTAAGSAFQVALLGDIRIGHPEVRMGQPEINAGIASITGPWIMKEMLGLSRTVELTLTGRMMAMEECYRIGLVHYVVPREDVLGRALEIAGDLAAKARLAIGLIAPGLPT